MSGKPVQAFVLYPLSEAAGLYHDTPLVGNGRGDSGVDVPFPTDVTIAPNASRDGIAMIVSLGVRARCWSQVQGFQPFLLMPRSSIAKTPISMANSVGLIDAGYTGELKVAIRNHSDQPWTIPRGTALFQVAAPDLAPTRVVLARTPDPIFENSARGEGGFGSTGIAGTSGIASAGTPQNAEHEARLAVAALLNASAKK